MKPSIEYPATLSAVKRGLRARKLNGTDAAQLTGQSRSLVSMVLSGVAKSQPCLDKLAAYLNGRCPTCGRPREEAEPPVEEVEPTAVAQ